jgi:hypothetical protein
MARSGYTEEVRRAAAEDPHLLLVDVPVLGGEPTVE